MKTDSYVREAKPQHSSVTVEEAKAQVETLITADYFHVFNTTLMI